MLKVHQKGQLLKEKVEPSMLGVVTGLVLPAGMVLTRMPMEEAMEAVVLTWKEGLTTVGRVAVVELLNWKQAAWGLSYLVAFVAPWMEVGGKVEGGK